MGESFQKRITALLLSNKRHTRYVAMVACMAVAVVFGVTVGLTQEGQAKTHEEKVLDCQYSGDAAHTHDASCYDADGNLVCTLAEREYHVHDDSCYASETRVVCGMEEGEGAHTHDESCYDEEGNLVCGLEESAGHVHTDECYQTDTWLACGKEEVTEEHTHGEGCFKTIIVEDEPAAEPAKAEEAKPAKVATAESGEQTFTGELKDADGNVVVSVAVKAPKGALPDGATMRVKAVDEAAIKDKVDEAVKAESGGDATVKSMTAVDIAFLDKDGNEVEPSQKVEVKITSAAVRDIDAPALVHIDEKTDTAEVVRDTTKVNADDKDTSTGNEDTLKFDTDKFSPFVVVEVAEAEEAAPVAETAPAMPAQSFEGTAGDVTVVAKAPEGAFPAGTTMAVAPVASDDVIESVQGAVTGSVKELVAVDITFYNAEGEQVQPLVPIKVTMTNAAAPAQGEPTVVHVDDEGAASVVEQSLITSANDEVVFDADSFSVYAMVITTQYISASGEAYDVTVTYGPEAGIPEGAWLSVTEYEKGTPEYEAALKALLAAKEQQGELVYDVDAMGFVALDISIMDAEGNEVEPAAEVQVDMSIKSLPGVEDLSEVAGDLEVQHHVETEEGVIVDTVFTGATESQFAVEGDGAIAAERADEAVDPASVDLTAAQADPDAEIDLPAIEASFGTEAFSTYTISWGNNRYRIHYVDTNGNSLTPTRTPEFSNGYKFLIYDVKDYEYDSTHYGSRTGTAIKPLLANYGNDRVYLDNNNNWQYLRNDIYVVYKAKTAPTQGGTPSSSTDETWPDQEDPARKPQFTKSSTNNGNNTNNISLTITAPEKPVSKSTPADVIVVFDVSGSMSNNMNGRTRLERAKTAVNDMADKLLNGENSDVRMALISFSTIATEVQGFTSSYSQFSQTVTNLNASGGTNWEQALQLANTMQVRSDAATFVVFVTDGDPTFRVSRGNVSDSDLDLYSDGTYQYYRNNFVFGEGNDDSDDRNFDFAVDQVSAIDGANKNFYAIGISNDVTKVRNLTTQGGVAADHAFIASDSTAMENAFKAITEAIKSRLGFGNVEMTDGITALTNAEMKVMQTVDPNSFKYYRYGGENNKYGNGYANKTEWTTREADGCAAATYSESDGAVHWDMGETFQLEDKVTYVVEFTVWPSQAALDLVADLNNGIKTYAGLTEAEKAQVVEVTPPTATTTGTYALKTNTDEVSATYNRTTKTGDTVTVSDTTDVPAEYHEGTLQNMALASDYITIRKEWHNALDSRVVDGITLTVTKDDAPYLNNVTLNGDNSWTSGNEYISAGLITKTADGRYNVRETGHEYTVTEPASFSYYWDLTADVYRPMVVNGELEMLVKTDSPTGTEGTDYFVIGGNRYQVSTNTHPQLVAKNDRRSNLNLKKLVTAETQAVDNVPNPDDVFTYTITVTDVNGDDVWFSAQDTPDHNVPIESYSANVTPELDAEGNPTGSYSVPSGEEFWISIKAGWNVRFFNLPTGTTYSIQETGMVDGYEFVKAETSAEVTNPDYADDYKATPGAVDGDTVTGTMDQPNNVYSTEYTNNWNPNNEIVITKTDENGDGLAGATFKLSKQAADGWTDIATFTSKADAGETFKVGHGLYKLEETGAPTNYAKTETVYFEVTTSGNDTTVTLVDAEGEEATYVDVTARGNEVTIKDWPLTTADASKAWKNADGSTTAPTGATVVYTLYADGNATEYTVTLDGTADTVPTGAAGYESEGWKATFANLPKFRFVDGEAIEIVYTIAETTGYPGYTASTTDPVASGSTITNTQESTTADATKTWTNADGSTSVPDREQRSVTFTLYADGTATDYTVTLDGTADTTVPTTTRGYESEAWKATFVNLPKYQAGTTTEIAYTVAETGTYPGFTPSTTDPVKDHGSIDNEQVPTEATATKAWKNADGTTTAPEGATVEFTLYADGAATDYTVTLDGTADSEPTGTAGYESEAWKAEFVNLKKYRAGTTTEIVYTVAETTTYPGYTPSTTDPVASGGTITNTQDSTTADASKAWKNADGTTTAPEGATVTYTLYANGEATDYTVTLDGAADETVPPVTSGYESAGWTATFVNLPKYQAGTTTEIVYTVAETTTWPGYTPSTTGAVASGGTITNTQEPTTADATKAWKNADGTATAPEGATVVYTLYADGTATSYTVTLDGTADSVPTGTAGYESEAWKATFVNLPKYQDGTTTEIVYTVAETMTYPGYTASTTAPVASGGTITNTQGSTGINATKAWKNADGTTTAPEGATVTYTLYADGTATDYAVTLDGTADGEPTGTAGYESEAWKAEFVNLPKTKVVDGEAVEIVYTIAETTGYPGYTASTTEQVGSGSTITNTQDPTTADASKAWKNADGTTAAPQGGQVTYTLYADGTATSYTVTLDGTADSVPTGTAGYESEAWKATFVNLPKYQAGTTTEIVYTVAETKTFPGYTASTTDPVASGGTITNTQEATEADATKAWVNADGTTTPPEGAKVSFTLYADEAATEYVVELDGTAEANAPTVTGGYESEAWKAQFVNLPKYKVVEGKAVEIVYTIAETTTFPGYSATPATAVASGETITNEQDATSANALKAWKNADGSETAPKDATVVYTLYADSTVTNYTVTLDGTADDAPTGTAGYESEAWKAEFVNLPKSKVVDGKAVDIVYTIAETKTFPGYTASTTDPVASGGTITNTQVAQYIIIAKVNTSGTPLTGAEFKLYSDADHKTQVTKDATGTIDLSTITVTSEDGVDLGALADGTYYLVETKAPAGYNLPEQHIKITVSEHAVTAEGAQDVSQNTETGVWTIKVANSAGEALPMTGGPGTTLFTITGTAIIAVAVTYGIASRRRRERGLD